MARSERCWSAWEIVFEYFDYSGEDVDHIEEDEEDEDGQRDDGDVFKVRF